MIENIHRPLILPGTWRSPSRSHCALPQNLYPKPMRPKDSLNWRATKIAYKLVALWLTILRYRISATLEGPRRHPGGNFRLPPAGTSLRRSPPPRIPSRPARSCSATWRPISQRDTARSRSSNASGSRSFLKSRANRARHSRAGSRPSSLALKLEGHFSGSDTGIRTRILALRGPRPNP
jgi:hypothetical protein